MRTIQQVLGRVVSNPQYVQVLWRAGSYLSNVSQITTPSIATFLTNAAGAGLFDWMDTEYNTVNPSAPKTNQHLGRMSHSPSESA